MKVKFQQASRVLFETLKPGDTFCYSVSQLTVFVKLMRGYSIDLSGRPATAVDLTTGQLVRSAPDDKVIPVEGAFIEGE